MYFFMKYQNCLDILGPQSVAMEHRHSEFSLKAKLERAMEYTEYFLNSQNVYPERGK